MHTHFCRLSKIKTESFVEVPLCREKQKISAAASLYLVGVSEVGPPQSLSDGISQMGKPL